MHKQRTVRVAVVVLAAMTAFGCSGGSDDKSGGASSQEKPVAAAPVAPAPSRVAPSTFGEGPASAAPAAKAPKLIKLPKVAGENAAIAEDQLRRLGFTNIRLNSSGGGKVGERTAEWTVKKVSPKAGKKLKAGALIVLTCTRI
ncbi:PASTA domain-containing protein [Actinoplanes friuliensis]|jgi:hypothetical protein|nr:PASTA domain-containing protein [Actinoplanes friuliensis]